jgi:hypothetical protein
LHFAFQAKRVSKAKTIFLDMYNLLADAYRAHEEKSEILDYFMMTIDEAKLFIRDC